MGGSDGDERLLTTFVLDRSVMVEWTGIAMAGFLVALFGLGGLYAVVLGPGSATVETGSLGGWELASGFLVTVLLLAGVVVLHELVHGAVIRHYGGDVSYGVGLAGFVLPYAYATTTSRLTRNQFAAVALAPLVLITAVGVPVMVVTESLWLLLPLAFNVAGAVGDVWMTGVLLRYPSHVTVEDSVTGFRIYGRDGDRPRPATGTRRFVRRVALGTGVGFGLLVLVALAAPVLLSVLGIGSLVVGAPGTPWSVFAFEGTPDGGFSSSVSPVGLLAASALLGFVLALLSLPVAPHGADGPPPDRR